MMQKIDDEMKYAPPNEDIAVPDHFKTGGYYGFFRKGWALFVHKDDVFVKEEENEKGCETG